MKSTKASQGHVYLVSLCILIGFSIQKKAILYKVKEIKDLSGGVLLYAARAKLMVDAEIVQKSTFWMKTI